MTTFLESTPDRPAEVDQPLVLFAGGEPGSRHVLNKALLEAGCDVWMVPDDMAAHQVLNLEGARIAALLVALPQAAARRANALADRVRSLNPAAAVIQCIAPDASADLACSGIVCRQPCDVEAVVALVRASLGTEV